MLLEMNVSLKRGNFDLSTELSIQDESMGLIGRSGAGKSTILSLLAGTLMPESGRIILNGQTLFDSYKGIIVPREQRPIGAVLQYDHSSSANTVKDTIFLAYERTLKQQRGLNPELLIDFLDIGHLLNQRMSHLSTGERQRVLLAKALLKSPKLLLLDDPFPTIGSDANPVTPFLKQVRKEWSLPLFYASHKLGDIAEFSDKVAIMNEGRIIRIGIINDLLRETGLIKKISMREFKNKMPAIICGHDTESGCSLAKAYGIELILPLRSDLPVSSWVTVAISSNEIALSRNYLSGISIQNQIKGQICALIPNDNHMLVQIDCGNTWMASITLRAYQDMNLHEGDSIYCLAKTQAFTYWPDTDPESFNQLFNAERLDS